VAYDLMRLMTLCGAVSILVGMLEVLISWHSQAGSSQTLNSAHYISLGLADLGIRATLTQ